MSHRLFILSTGPYAGKSLVTLGVGHYFKTAGRRIGYMKPVGTNPVVRGGIVTDGDALFVAQALGLDHPAELLCPVVLDRARRLSVLEGEPHGEPEIIDKAFAALTPGVDLFLLGGAGRIDDGYSLGIGAGHLAERLDAKVLLVDRGGEPEDIDTILGLAGRFGPRLAGVVFNRVPPPARTLVLNLVAPYLERHGIRVIGTIPQEDSLEFLTVGELATILGGELLTATDHLGSYVERYVIGAMRPEAALTYFRSHPNKAVITGGDRADLLLAALETQTRCLILTGGLYPTQPVIARASEKGIPILVVGDDTLTTFERIDDCLGTLRLRGAAKAATAEALVGSSCDLSLLAELLNMK